MSTRHLDVCLLLLILTSYFQAGVPLQSMPPKKRSASKKKKKEVLPDPNTISNGECNYYIGTWSHYQNIDAISDIAHTVLEQHTSADGEVGELPRTNILIPACGLGVAGTHYAVEVANNIVVESVPRTSMKNATQLKDETDVAGDEALEREETVDEKQDVDQSAEVNETEVGASQSACDVIVHGTVHIDGIVTRIVIKPDLPDPPVVPQTRRKSAVKRKKSAKAIEEEQRRLAEATKIYEEKVNAAVTAAREEEEYRMQFAHPNRWSHVVFSNITFTGQVIVSHAHVTFRNCAFSARAVNVAQLLVTQYCQVECIRCTFECPERCGMYGLPMGRLKFQRCLFTGNPTTFSLEKRATDEARTFRGNAVGLHTDSCCVTVEDCQFKDLETAILLRGSYPDSTAEKPAMVVRTCRVENIFGSGIVLDNVHGVELMKNEFIECDYYSLDCVKGKDIRVFQNKFHSEVRVQKHAHVKLMHNRSGTVPLTLKEVDNPNWQPVY
ncbi:hypothetical protein MOQ_006317 [Trypanosoma cruzi marinkellei]|uniref:Right handed beta helix domain-containing protein n=1 Tax=Trypanosoma cruzi marinkellei TaxID=85056 RepID=K2N5B1_TRYCR|nr:hypothetical protein MOQ_006317 [Trypanosoma cruzi marinkellei]